MYGFTWIILKSEEVLQDMLKYLIISIHLLGWVVMGVGGRGGGVVAIYSERVKERLE